MSPAETNAILNRGIGDHTGERNCAAIYQRVLALDWSASPSYGRRSAGDSQPATQGGPGRSAVSFFVIGVIGLSSTVSANVADRTREFGVMHALGAAPGIVRRIVRLEAALLFISGILVGIVPALVTTRILGDGLGTLFLAAPLPYRISLPALGIWLALALLAGLLATDAAASRAAGINVREALSYG